MKNKKKLVIGILIVAIGITLSSCAAGPNELIKVEDGEGNLAGFFYGLWHGFTLLFTFIISLFNSDVNIYEVHNAGPLYNLGYLLGVSVFFSGSGKASSKKKK